MAILGSLGTRALQVHRPATQLTPPERRALDRAERTIAAGLKSFLEVGLALKETPAKGRLIDTGGLAKKDRITHRIEITSSSDVDAFVEKWLRRAYAMDD